METCADKLILAFLELKHRKLLTGLVWTGHSDDRSSIAIIYRQFVALADCIGLGLEGETPDDRMEYFEAGKFIKKRPPEKYAAVVTTLEAYHPHLKTDASWLNDSFQYRYRQVSGLFIGLMAFKLKTDFRYYGPLEGTSTGSEYAHYLRTGAFDAAAVSKINSLLGHVIDPQQTAWDVERLVKDFGYPRDDYESRYLHERINEVF